jgi:uncharacterized protein (DUF1697 family)
MKELTAMFEAEGCRDVASYIQSGNVVFSAGAKVVKQLAPRIGARIRERFGFDSPVVLRTGGELVAISEANPFIDEASNPLALHVAFLADEPDDAKIAALDPKRSPTDRFAVKGREIYLCCPNGLGRSKLTNDWFDRKLATVSTMRNWRTLLELIALTS